MEKAAEEIFKTFTHLAREVLIYLFSGAVLLMNAAFLDQRFNAGRIWCAIGDQRFLVPGIVVAAYVLGQFSMAFYYVLLEHPKEKQGAWLEKILGFEPLSKAEQEAVERKKGELYALRPELYLHFVERLVLMEHVRWTLSAACLIAGVVDIVVASTCSGASSGSGAVIWVVAASLLFVALALYLLTICTYRQNIESLESYLGAIEKVGPSGPATLPGSLQREASGLVATSRIEVLGK